MVALGLALRCNQEPYHRCLILSDTKADQDFVVLVRITTQDGTWPDQACLLTPRDWPGVIEHDSVVAYSTANVAQCKAVLEKSIRQGTFSVLPSPPPEVLRRIGQIGRTYDFTPPLAKRHIANF